MIGLVLSVTLVHVGLLRTGKQEMRYGPLFYGKQLKAFEFQLIVYDFKVGTLAQPRLPDWHGRILEIWRALGRSATRTTGSGRWGGGGGDGNWRESGGDWEWGSVERRRKNRRKTLLDEKWKWMRNKIEGLREREAAVGGRSTGPQTRHIRDLFL